MTYSVTAVRLDDTDNVFLADSEDMTLQHIHIDKPIQSDTLPKYWTVLWSARIANRSNKCLYLNEKSNQKKLNFTEVEADRHWQST